jgi:hypothetical protein
MSIAPGPDHWTVDCEVLFAAITSAQPETSPAMARLFVLRFLRWVENVTPVQAAMAFACGAETIDDAVRLLILPRRPPSRYRQSMDVSFPCAPTPRRISQWTVPREAPLRDVAPILYRQRPDWT